MSKEPDTAECVESPLRTQGLIATRCIETSEAGVEQQQQKQCDRDPSIASHRTEANVSGSMRTGDVPTVAHSTIHPPSIQWSQNKDSVFLNIRNAAEAADTSSVCTMSCDFQSTSLEALDKPHTADTLRIVLGSQAVELQLFSLFVLQDSSVKACRDSWTVKVVLKKETDATWPRLTKSAEKHHFVSLDWSKWNEDCDESSLNDAIPSNVPIAEGTPVTLPDGRLVRVPPLAPFGDYGSEVMEIQTADCQTIPDATVPPLKSLLADDENLKSNARQFWVSSLTTAQKLHTLTEMWNAVPSSNRGALLRALVELVTPTNPSIANSIKGGDEVMRDLASSEYSCRYVTYVEPWVKTIKRDCTAHEQLCILAELFKSITDFYAADERR